VDIKYRPLSCSALTHLGVNNVLTCGITPRYISRTPLEALDVQYGLDSSHVPGGYLSIAEAAERDDLGTIFEIKEETLEAFVDWEGTSA